jgi:hypothetical protein
MARSELASDGSGGAGGSLASVTCEFKPDRPGCAAVAVATLRLADDAFANTPAWE